jgi:hypothetical protein
MTLDGLLELARKVAPRDIHPQFANDPDVRLGRAIRDLLGHAWPCGWPQPEARDRLVHWESLGNEPLTPDEALALAAGLIRAAMEARR